MLKILVGYPEHDEELTVVQRSLVAAPELRRVLELERLRELQDAAAAVYVDPGIVSYTVQLATATRDPGAYGLGDLAPFISFGASPRGPISLVQSARALAFIRGRDYVVVAGRRLAREGRAPPPARAQLPGARRAGRRRHGSSTRCSRR